MAMQARISTIEGDAGKISAAALEKAKRELDSFIRVTFPRPPATA
jgi:hypothetical protein